MSRDPGKLKVFALADEFVAEVYEATRSFPVAERFGLQAQLRRAAISIPTNIVEGCARRTQCDYVHFLTIALGSACETRYLLRLCRRLGLIEDSPLGDRADHIARALQKLIEALQRPAQAASRKSQV